MKDYEVKPLFSQVRKDLPRLSVDMKDPAEIDDHRGCVYDAFSLRRKATRAG